MVGIHFAAPALPRFLVAQGHRHFDFREVQTLGSIGGNALLYALLAAVLEGFVAFLLGGAVVELRVADVGVLVVPVFEAEVGVAIEASPRREGYEFHEVVHHGDALFDVALDGDATLSAAEGYRGADVAHALIFLYQPNL